MAFTYFFRDMQTLKLISSVVVPVLRGQRYINVWDAGCAHGPEPYSVAMMLRENMTYMLFRNVRIYATDIDTCDQFGKTITDGVYPDNELRRSPANLREKYFVRADRPNCCRIIDEIRSRVSFVK
ncbi:MAG: chemotaxis protein CheR, partial [Planctomycetota bacterium]